MKIEMGESLFYSWLRHVKTCQMVQTNWKCSRQWDFQHEDELDLLMKAIDAHFNEKYGYSIFKGNTSLSQLVHQGECDAVGIQFAADGNKTYAIDVAFHEAGLQYGDRKTTVMKVIEKCARTAFCLYGYLGWKDTEIIFASPKINPSVLSDLEPCISDLNDIFIEHGFDFIFCIIANDEYYNQVLQPILNASKGIADTSELFLRSYQMFAMFSEEKSTRPNPNVPKPQHAPKPQLTFSEPIEQEYIDSDAFCELKIGQLAQRVLGKMLRDNKASPTEIEQMQTFEYSKKQFDIQYPLLVRAGTDYSAVRYYSKPIFINGVEYYLCSQWFEVPANNDRPYLLKWISLHT